MAVVETQRAKPIETANHEVFSRLLKQHKVSTDEYARLIECLGRTPSLAELGVFSAMWSEHCSYKSSRVHLKRFPTTGPNVVVGPGENAGVVRLSGKLCVAFKMESHNHPSYIEPFQGAATGVGGILRDVFCMGARPIANLNCLRFGEKSHPKTKWIRQGVVDGIAHYGNCIGVATVAGSVSYDKTYNGNCLVNAMNVGLIHEDKIFKGYATGLGNLVVYVGSATGRDGVNGASMASDSFSSQDANEKSTVQVGDPYAEKLLLEATLEVLSKGLVVGIQDMGAAGITSSSFEMAGRAGNGVNIDLDKVPLRAKNMSAYEIMLSESQERMLMVIEPKNWNALSKLLDKWGLAHAVIGEVTNSGRVLCRYKGVVEVDIPVEPLTEQAPVYKRPIGEPKTPSQALLQNEKIESNIKAGMNAKELLLRMLSESGSSEPIYRQYDHHIGTRTVLGPEEQGASVLWIRSEETKKHPWIGLGVTAGCNERRVKNNPLIGGQSAVLDCAKALTAAGSKPLAVTDCLNFGSAEDPAVMREFSDSVDGISMACQNLSIPVVSGNVSLYNSTDQKSIHPTPMIGMVGKVDDIRQCTPAIVREDSKIYLMAPMTPRFDYAASLAGKVCDIDADQGAINQIDWSFELSAMDLIQKWHDEGKLISCRDIKRGGVILTAAKMVLPALEKNEKRELQWTKDFKQSLFWQNPFGECGAAYLMTLTSDSAEFKSTVEQEAKKHQLAFFEIAELKGATNSQTNLELPGTSVTWPEIKEVFRRSNDWL
jgi:phosphoribosylformylglycinamidine synthase subunit PurL